MTKSELLVVAKLIDSIVKKQMDSSVQPLLKEIAVLKKSVNKLLVEQTNRNTITETKSNNNMGDLDILDSIFSEPTIVKKQTTTSNVLSSILAETQPLSRSELSENTVESVLDIVSNNKSEDDDPVSKVLTKLKTTNFKEKLDAMERYSNKQAGITS